MTELLWIAGLAAAALVAWWLWRWVLYVQSYVRFKRAYRNFGEHMARMKAQEERDGPTPGAMTTAQMIEQVDKLLGGETAELRAASAETPITVLTPDTLVPIGEYMATIDDFSGDAFEVVDFEYKSGDRAGTPGTMTKLTIPFVIQDDRVKRQLQRDKVTVSKQLILDLEDDGKTLATGPNKNIELGRIRAAVSQDRGLWSISMLRGAGPLMVKVTHVEYKRRDGSKGKRAEIERVTRSMSELIESLRREP